MKYPKYDNCTPIHWQMFDSTDNGYALLVRESLRPFIGEAGTVLDIGSGDARVDRILVDMGFSVIGIEPEPQGNVIACEKVPEMRIIESTIEKAELPEADYLYSLNTIEHCDKPERFVEAMCKIKRFGVVVTDNKRDTIDPYHIREYTIDELKVLFKDFKTEELNLKNPAFIGLKIYV